MSRPYSLEWRVGASDPLEIAPSGFLSAMAPSAVQLNHTRAHNDLGDRFWAYRAFGAWRNIYAIFVRGWEHKVA